MGKIIKGRKSYTIPIMVLTIFHASDLLYVPIQTKNSFKALIRNTKFTHIGTINKRSSVDLFFSLQFAIIYATGYAIKRQISVLINEINKLLVIVLKVYEEKKALIPFPLSLKN